MKELFIKLKEAEEKANKADAAYEANPYDEELERAIPRASREVSLSQPRPQPARRPSGPR